MNDYDDLEIEDTDDLVAATRKSRFLTKEDAGDGIVGTIAKAGRAMIDFDGYSRPEERTVIIFKEGGLKPFIANSTNVQLIAQIAGSRDPKKWVGVQIELYHDRSVSFGGKLLGGIRVRAPKQPKNGGGSRTRKPARLGAPVSRPAVKPADEPIKFGEPTS
jgi:hypothetical protein